jgi:CheY-like chemotaxis protein
LRGRILAGEFAEGERLPAHTALAAEFGISPMTARQVLQRLEREGLVTLKPGLGTFVSRSGCPSVLVVDDEAEVRAVLGRYIARAGYDVVEANGPVETLAALERDPSIALVLTDIRMPTAADGLGLIRAVRRRWPQLALAVVTGFPNDLTELWRSPDSPVLVVHKPFRGQQIEQVLQLTLESRPLARQPAGPGEVHHLCP